MSPEAGRQLVEARARELGFAQVGVCDAAPTVFDDALQAWLDDGQHGSMSYLERHRELLRDPAGLLPGAQSIICVADQYATGQHEPDGPGRIPRYARGRDYHKVIRRRLHALADALRETWPDDEFRACVDTAPLLEREYAARAGLGAIGKHTLLLRPGHGSWSLLGEIVTTRTLAPSRDDSALLDPCGSCTRCIDACPTDAITPWSVDARRCIAYLTIEHRERIDPADHAAIGHWLFGCDICQEVCPHGTPTRRSRRAAEIPEAYTPRRDRFDLLDVLSWDSDTRLERCAGTALTRARLEMMKRNALIVAGNVLAKGPAPALQSRIEELAADPDESELVRETARDVLDRLVAE